MRRGVEFVNADCSRSVKRQLEQTAAGVLEKLDRGFQLSSLDMSNVPFTMCFLRELRRGLSHNLNLERLYLNGCQLTCVHAMLVTDMLVDNRKIGGKIRTMSMENNKLKSLGAIHLSRALLTRKEHPPLGSGLHRLALNGNHIGPTACKRFAEVLVGESSLRVLSLQRNSIDDWGAGWLSLIMRNNSSIEFLDVRGNPIGVDGADELRRACVNGRPNLCWTFVMRLPEDMFARSKGRRRIFVSVPPGVDAWLKGNISKTGATLPASATFRSSNPNGGKLWAMAENQQLSEREVKTTVRLVSSRFRWKYRASYSPERGSSKDSHLFRRPASAPLRCTRPRAESVSSLPPRSLGDAGSTASLCAKPTLRPKSSANRALPPGSPPHSVQFNLEATNRSLSAQEDDREPNQVCYDPRASVFPNDSQHVARRDAQHAREQAGAARNNAYVSSQQINPVEVAHVSTLRSSVAPLVLPSSAELPEQSTGCGEVVHEAFALQGKSNSKSASSKRANSRVSDTEVAQAQESALHTSSTSEVAAPCGDCLQQDGERVTVSAQRSASSAYIQRGEVQQDMPAGGNTSDDTGCEQGSGEGSASPDEVPPALSIVDTGTTAAALRHAESLTGIRTECARPNQVPPILSTVDPSMTAATIHPVECSSGSNVDRSNLESGEARHPNGVPSESSLSQDVRDHIVQLSADVTLSCLDAQVPQENVNSSDYSDDFLASDGSVEPATHHTVDNNLKEAATRIAAMTSDTSTIPIATTEGTTPMQHEPATRHTVDNNFEETAPQISAMTSDTTTTPNATAEGTTPMQHEPATRHTVDNNLKEAAPQIPAMTSDTTTIPIATAEGTTPMQREPRQRKEYDAHQDMGRQGTPSPLSDRVRAQSVERPLTPLSVGNRRELSQRGIASPRSASKEAPRWLEGANPQPSARRRKTTDDTNTNTDDTVQLLVSKWEDKVGLPSSMVQACVDTLLREEEVSKVETHIFTASVFGKVLRKLQLADAIEITSEIYTLEDMLNTLSDNASGRGRKRAVKRRQHKAYC